MSCRAVRKWVWRRGAEDLPPSLAGHVDGCTSCQGLVADVGLLDGAVCRDETPDPGEAYWNAFGPRLARRLEGATQPVILVAPAPVWWRWVRRWSPVVGVAILAVLLGRSAIEEYTPPVGYDSEVPVSPTVRSDMREGAPDQVPDRSAAGVVDALTAEQTADPQRVVTQAPQPHEIPVGSAEGVIESEEDRAGSDELVRFDRSPEDAVGTVTEGDVPSVDDGQVWPERQVFNLGQVSSDTDHQPLDDDRLLTEQGSFGVYERRMAYSGLSSETAGVHPLPSRLLEGPRLLPSAGFADSETPTEAMRRYDQIRELRSMIGELQSVPLESRTAEQSGHLSSLWYRLGTITGEVTLIDSAIQVLGEYLETLPVENAPDWTARRDFLIQRRDAVNR